MPAGNSPHADGNQIPRLEVINRQRVMALDFEWLRAGAQAALSECLALARESGGALANLEEVCVTLVSDRKIAALHRDFMGIPGATDVITFQHGEVVVSTQTASRVALERGLSFHSELLLYILHGFLHLAGYDDVSAEDFSRMHQIQDKLWEELVRVIPREPRG
jgi:probable rRNA maturation factor